MHLKQIQIKNFRGIKELELTLPLDKLCILIGENNSGKSSILDALQICLSKPISNKRQLFDDYDYHLEDATASPENSPPIEIILTFSEVESGEWDESILGPLEGAIQIDIDSELNIVTVQVKSQFDLTSNNYEMTVDFLRSSGERLNVYRSHQLLYELRRLIPYHHLDSLRNAASEFRANSEFWKPFLSSPDLSEKERESIEHSLQELNQEILDKHTSFESIKRYLGKTAKFLPLGTDETVAIEAIPTRIFDVLSKTQVLLEAKTGAHIPIIRHGSGTQSFAVICLFEAFLRDQLKSESRDPLTTLEEPEAHLHPSAVQVVSQMLGKLPGQKVVATHSGDILANVELKLIRRLRKVNGSVTAFEVKDGVFKPEEIAKLKYHIRNTRGELLYSRCWVLVEGKTDATILSYCSQALKCNLYAEGVSLVEAGNAVKEIVKLANQLGIEWLIVVDKDDAGNKYRRSAESHLNSKSVKDRVFQLEHGNLELFLCMEGYGHLYKDNVSPQKEQDVIPADGTIDYWNSVIDAQSDHYKTHMADRVGKEMIETEKVPSQLEEIIKQSVKLASSTQ